MKTNIHHFSKPEAMAAAAAEYLLKMATDAVARQGFFSLVLAGGRTPEALYRLLAAPPLADQMPWGATHIFQGDERCVAPDHPASNFKLAAETLLIKGRIPAANIHRMKGELPPAAGAEEYRRELEKFGHNFDLILLGMGTDGHIASLFPGSPLLEEQERTVDAETNPAGSPPLPRITLTLPPINRSATVIIMVTGPEKAAIVSEINQGVIEREARRVTGDSPQQDRLTAEKYPAARVRPVGELLWLVSEEG